MSWSVVQELGIEYAPRMNAQESRPLQFPVYAAKASDGSYLIVDEVCAEKPIPFRMEYRTIRVDPSGQVVFDTTEQGIEDGYGCLIEGDSVAILRRTKWELFIVSPRGTVTDCINLTKFSKYLPRIVSWTDQQTFLILFLDRSGRLDIVEIDRQGRLLWYLPSCADYLGVPASVQRLPSNTLLLADAFWSVILEADRAGNIVWQFGKSGNPGKSPACVSGPTCVRALADGRRLISDTRNHRLLSVAVDGTSLEVGPGEGKLSDPTYADTNRDGHLLICDSGNARVIELDNEQRIVWQYGSPIRTERRLSFPRSVEITASGEYLIADTANDRVVSATSDCAAEQSASQEVELFWPRCVRSSPTGSLIIADGRNGRIVELSKSGQILNEIFEIKWNGLQKLEDPHDVRTLPNGHLLITDSPRNFVFEVDWSGQVHRVIGDDESVSLDDPHAAQQLNDGRFVICDTGHHRILFVDQRGKFLDSFETVHGDEFVLRMKQPKYLEVNHDGTMVVVDTGNNRVLASTTDGQLIWEISEISGSPLPHLHQPRWATMVNRDELLISDHFHHRVVHLRRHQHSPASGRRDPGGT